VNASPPRPWIRAAILLGVAYIVIGRVPVPADHVQAWRLAAWAISAVVYAWHIWYEHFGLRNSPRLAAAHVALAVAIGGFGLAVAGLIHSLSGGTGIRPAWLIAIVVWPVMLAIPAFLGAYVAGSVLPTQSAER
jgi:hypothetical protein